MSELTVDTRIIELLREIPIQDILGTKKTMIKCPFHNDGTPSFAIYTHDNSFHCFGCGKHGKGAIDFAIHYHVDWAKMNLNAKLGWGPTTHEQFWWLLGLDQFLHALTYIMLVALITA